MTFEEKLDRILLLLEDNNEKISYIHQQAKNINKKEYEDIFKRWAIMYGLNVVADNLTGQVVAPQSFI